MENIEFLNNLSKSNNDVYIDSIRQTVKVVPRSSVHQDTDQDVQDVLQEHKKRNIDTKKIFVEDDSGNFKCVYEKPEWTKCGNCFPHFSLFLKYFERSTYVLD